MDSRTWRSMPRHFLRRCRFAFVINSKTSPPIPSQGRAFILTMRADRWPAVKAGKRVGRRRPARTTPDVTTTPPVMSRQRSHEAAATPRYFLALPAGR